MGYNIRKAVVIGSGTMGGGIASLLAGVGVETVLLDIPARDTQPTDPKAKRSAVALEGVKRRMDEIRELAGERASAIRFGIAGTIICRDTHEEAWAQAQAMLDHADQPVLEQRMGSGHRTTSVEDQLVRQRGELHMARNLGAGMGRLS